VGSPLGIDQPKRPHDPHRADRWRGITVGEFEQRQLRTIREELDRAHVERVRPVVRPNASASAVKLSSKSRT
jgi:hypothetical protein